MACGGLVKSFYPLLTAQNTSYDPDRCPGSRPPTSAHHRRCGSPIGRRSTLCPGVRGARGGPNPNVPRCCGSWSHDLDGRFRPRPSPGSPRSVSGQEVEQRTRRRHSADLVAAGLGLRRWAYHLGSCGAGSRGDHSFGGFATPPLDRCLRATGRRQNAAVKGELVAYSAASARILASSASCAASVSACCLTRRRNVLVRSSFGFSSTSFGEPSSTTTP